MSKNVEMLVYIKENLPKVPMTGLIVENAEEAEMEADAKANPADDSDYFFETWIVPMKHWKYMLTIKHKY